MPRKPTNNNPEEISKALNNNNEKIPAFTLGEVGKNGLSIFNGVSNEELKQELNHPNSVKTYKQMSYHPSINAPLSLYCNTISKAYFRIVPVKNPTAKEKKQAEIVETMFQDMEHSMDDLVNEIMTMMVYGFAPVEKVFRRRNTASGSMYNDNLIGIRKLKLRSQESIEKFIFSDDGNEVIALKQNLAGISDPYNRFSTRTNTEIIIPRSKFMLFNIGRNRSNPYGTSALRDVYLPWKYLQAIEELEANGIAKDISGMPVLSIPAQYMSEDASPEQKKIYTEFKNIVRNLQQGSQAGMILPSATDPDTRQPLFKLDLLGKEGKKAFDTTQIKEYYRTMIFIGLAADILLMGNTSTGSFALGSIKNSLTGNAVESYLKRIVQVINDDLIRQVYELNGWSIARRCRMDYEYMGDESIDEIGKYIQRVASVGLMPKNLDVVNKILTSIGIDKLPVGTDVEALLTDNTSRAADGMVSAGNGTSNSVASTDLSANNSDNAA